LEKCPQQVPCILTPRVSRLLSLPKCLANLRSHHS
jgi:hypothetical protein